MENYNTKNGKIQFQGNQLIINDDARKRKIQRLIIAGLWVVFAVSFFLYYLKKGDEFHLYVALVVGLGNIAILIRQYFVSTLRKVDISQVKNITIGKFLNKSFLKIQLIDGRKRKIESTNPNTDWKKLKQILEEKKTSVYN